MRKFIVDKFKGINNLVDSSKLFPGETSTLKGCCLKTGSIESLPYGEQRGTFPSPDLSTSMVGYAGVDGTKWDIPTITASGTVTGSTGAEANATAMMLGIDKVAFPLGQIGISGTQYTSASQITLFLLTQIISADDYTAGGGSTCTISATIQLGDITGPTGTVVNKCQTNTVVSFDSAGAYSCDYSRVWRSFIFEPSSLFTGSDYAWIVVEGTGIGQGNGSITAEVWDGSKTYSTDDYAMYQGVEYKCISGTSVPLDPYNDSTNWESFPDLAWFTVDRYTSIAYSSGTTYNIGDYVYSTVYAPGTAIDDLIVTTGVLKYMGLYVCKKDSTTNKKPHDNLTEWKYMGLIITGKSAQDSVVLPIWNAGSSWTPGTVVFSSTYNACYVNLIEVAVETPNLNTSEWSIANTTSGTGTGMLLFGCSESNSSGILALNGATWESYTSFWSGKNAPQFKILNRIISDINTNLPRTNLSSITQIGTVRLPFNSWTGVLNINQEGMKVSQDASGLIDSASLPSWGGGSLCTMERIDDNGNSYRAVLIKSEGLSGEKLTWSGYLGPDGKATVSIYPYTTLVRNKYLIGACAVGGESFVPITLCDDYQPVDCDYQSATFNCFLALSGGGTDGWLNKADSLNQPQNNNKYPVYIDFRYKLKDLSSRNTWITIKAYQKPGDKNAPTLTPIVDLPDYPAFVVSFGGSLIYANGRNGVGEYWSSSANSVTYFAYIQFASQTEQIRSVKQHETDLLFFLESQIIRFNGVPGAEQLTKLANFGLPSSRLVCSTPIGLFIVGNDGFYIFNGSIQPMPDKPLVIFEEQAKLRSFGNQPFQVSQVLHIPSYHCIALGYPIPNGTDTSQSPMLFYKIILYDYYLQDWYEYNFSATADTLPGTSSQIIARTAPGAAGMCCAIDGCLESAFIWDNPTPSSSGTVMYGGLIFKNPSTSSGYQNIEVTTGFIEVEPQLTHKKFLRIETEVSTLVDGGTLYIDVEYENGVSVPQISHNLTLDQSGVATTASYLTFQDSIGATARWIKITFTSSSLNKVKIHRLKIFYEDATK
jgi:hypothetical protein